MIFIILVYKHKNDQVLLFFSVLEWQGFKTCIMSNNLNYQMLMATSASVLITNFYGNPKVSVIFKF